MVSEVARVRAPVARAEGGRSFGQLGWLRINLGEAARPVVLSGEALVGVEQVFFAGGLFAVGGDRFEG